MQFVALLGQFLNTWGVMYDLHQEGQLPESQWIVVRTDILASLTTKGGLQFWKEIGSLNVSQEFADWVHELLNGNETPYPFLDHVGDS